MSLVKYRVKEVAADFGLPPKDISAIVAKFSAKPKSYSQILTDQELNAVFDYMTQTHQITSLKRFWKGRPVSLSGFRAIRRR